MPTPLAIQPQISLLQIPPTIQPVYLPSPSTTAIQYQPRPRPYRPRARRFRPCYSPRHIQHRPRNPQPRLTPASMLPRTETTTSTTDTQRILMALTPQIGVFRSFLAMHYCTLLTKNFKKIYWIL